MRPLTHRFNVARRYRLMCTQSIPLAPRREDEDVWKYPRPPALQRTPKSVHSICRILTFSRLQVIWAGDDGREVLIADTDQAYRVCETS